METETVACDRAALIEMEKRAVVMNARLIALIRALSTGDIERASSGAWMIQELNRAQRAALIAAGAPDSIAPPGGYSTVWDDDEPPVDADKLNLSELRSLPMDAPEGGE